MTMLSATTADALRTATLDLATAWGRYGDAAANVHAERDPLTTLIATGRVPAGHAGPAAQLPGVGAAAELRAAYDAREGARLTLAQVVGSARDELAAAGVHGRNGAPFADLVDALGAPLAPITRRASVRAMIDLNFSHAAGLTVGTVSSAFAMGGGLVVGGPIGSTMAVTGVGLLAGVVAGATKLASFHRFTEAEVVGRIAHHVGQGASGRPYRYAGQGDLVRPRAFLDHAASLASDARRRATQLAAAADALPAHAEAAGARSAGPVDPVTAARLDAREEVRDVQLAIDAAAAELVAPLPALGAERSSPVAIEVRA